MKMALIFWTALEMRSVDEAGSETDLGLGIGGRVKLTKTSKIQINSIGAGPDYRGMRYQSHVRLAYFQTTIATL